MAPVAIENSHSSTNGSTLKATAPPFHPTATSDPAQYHAASSEEAIESEHTYAAHNYHPLPIVFARASGCLVWDPEGKEYLDFLSAYSAVNQGHCHPELIKALTEQASRLTLSSRAFYNDVFPRFAAFVTKFFNYDMVLPMNTGAEAVETAVKIARKWGYRVKGIPQNEAFVLSVSENFHGRTVGCDTRVKDKSADEHHSLLPYPCPPIQSQGTIMDLTSQTWARSARALRKRYRTMMPKLSGQYSKLTVQK